MSASPTPAAARAEIHLSTAQLAAAVHLPHARLVRLVRLGIVEPPEPDTGEFTVRTAERLRRMLRLRRDLHVNLIGAAIILDLLERLDRLESELARAPRQASE